MHKKKQFYLLLIPILFSMNANTCICWFSTKPEAVKEKIKDADLIVYAIAMPDALQAPHILKETLLYTDSTLYVSDIVFKIEKVWKGEKLKTVKFEGKEFPCGDASYRLGERYILFGYMNENTGRLETNNCNSLSEETKLTLKDKLRMSHTDFDKQKDQEFRAELRKEFNSVIETISKESTEN